jgi:hypothetical protein
LYTVEIIEPTMGWKNDVNFAVREGYLVSIPTRSALRPTDIVKN